MFTNYYFGRIYNALFLVGSIILVGTFGYVLIEGWSFFESFYMTIITVTTVGFSEINELSTAGRVFTIFLIVTSFSTFAYAVSAVTSYVTSGEYKRFHKEQRTINLVRKMENHTIICGYGRVGKQAAQELLFYNKNFVVIEMEEKIINEKIDGLRFIHGDSTQDEILTAAGIKKAKAIIIALPKDTDNLFVVLSSRELNPALKIISRASNQSAVKKLKIAGASNVIMPDLIGGAHMASLVITPNLMEFMDMIKVSGKSTTNLEEISCDELPDSFRDYSIRDLEERTKSGCNVIGLRTKEGEYIINPGQETIIQQGCKLFVLGNPEQVKKMNALFGL